MAHYPRSYVRCEVAVAAVYDRRLFTQKNIPAGKSRPETANLPTGLQARSHVMVRKPKKALVHKRVRENVTAIMRAGGNEVSRCAQEYAFETVKTRFAIFSAVIDRRYSFARNRVSSFSWILSKPPLLKTTTTSFCRSIGMIRSTIAFAFCS